MFVTGRKNCRPTNIVLSPPTSPSRTVNEIVVLLSINQRPIVFVTLATILRTVIADNCKILDKQSTGSEHCLEESTRHSFTKAGTPSQKPNL